MQGGDDPLDSHMAAARNGDAAAYRAFLTEASVRLRAFVRRRMPDDAQMEDVVQQCLIAIHEKRGTLDPARPVAPWMFAIARYRMADHWRRVYREAPVEMQAEDEGEAPPESTAGHDIALLLGHLPRAQAEAIRMTRIEGLTMEEASARSGASVSAMKVRVHRGMARLSELVLEDER